MLTDSMKKKIRQYALPVIVAVLVSYAAPTYVHGVNLKGIPKKEVVSYVEITNTNITDEVRIFTEQEDIEMAINIVSLLKYRVGAPKIEGELITITYHLKDGGKISVSANKNVVHWKGKVYTIVDEKNGRIFEGATEVLFFN